MIQNSSNAVYNEHNKDTRKCNTGVTAAASPDSPWGRTARWLCDRYGRPLAFDSEADAREAAKAFHDQRCTFEPNYDYAVQPLERKEASSWGIEMN